MGFPGGTLNYSSYVGLDRAGYCLQKKKKKKKKKKNLEYQECHQKYLNFSNHKEISPFCTLISRKDP